MQLPLQMSRYLLSKLHLKSKLTQQETTQETLPKAAPHRPTIHLNEKLPPVSSVSIEVLARQAGIKDLGRLYV